MGLSIGDLVGGQDERIRRMLEALQFNIHVAIPCVVQKFDKVTRTVECQPTVRERMVDENNKISYIQYPVLVNVPVCFPQTTNASITFPIKRGDECIVIFQDVSIDNWWLNGNVQNPVEQRRHDLSDGIAIFGVNNQTKERTPYMDDAMVLNYGNSSIIIADDDVFINMRSMAEVFNVIDAYPSHIHTDSTGHDTSAPK